MVVFGDVWRSSAWMTSSVAPDLSSAVAWLWRNTCAPRLAKVLTPARSSARFASELTMLESVNARQGAWAQRNTFSSSTLGRTVAI